MRCGRCGHHLADMGEYLGHVCAPRKETSNLSPLQLEAAEEEARKAHLRGLDRDIELANERDFGPGHEQEDRFGDSSRQVRRLTADGRTETLILDRTGSAIAQERDHGGGAVFDADAEVPKDPYDRAEFLAREMRFPNEQRRVLGDRPWDKGMVTWMLTPEELAGYRHTGKLPEVSDERKHHPEKERQAAAAQGPSL